MIAAARMARHAVLRYSPAAITGGPTARKPSSMSRSMLLAAALLVLPGAAMAADLNVLYAGSLVNLMENGIGPAFTKATGDNVRGFAGGSGGLANQIKGKLRHADVFVSASPTVNTTLMGADNGDWVSWYLNFAQSPVVIGYNPSSRFAADLKTKPWYEVLREPGISIGRHRRQARPQGRTDRAADGKGGAGLPPARPGAGGARRAGQSGAGAAGGKPRRPPCNRARSMSGFSTRPRRPI